jgi:hypothetical protein
MDVDTQINYIWKNVRKDGACALHVFSEAAGIPHDNVDQMVAFLNQLLRQYKIHLQNKYRLDNLQSLEHKAAMTTYILENGLNVDQQGVALEQMQGEIDGVDRMMRGVAHIAHHRRWNPGNDDNFDDDGHFGGVGAFIPIMKWHFENNLGPEMSDYEFITYRVDSHAGLDIACNNKNNLCDWNQIQDTVNNAINGQGTRAEQVRAKLNENKLIIFFTTGVHWGVLMPLGIWATLTTQSSELASNAQDIQQGAPPPPAPQSSSGKLPAAPSIVDTTPSIPPWFNGKNYEPHFEGSKDNKSDPLTMVVPKFMDNVDKCAMIYDMLHDFADEGAVTNEPWRQYWIFIKIATAIFVKENATIKEQQEEEENVIKCLNSVFRNFWKINKDGSVLEEDKLLIPIPEYNKGEILYDKMNDYNDKHKGFFRDMKSFLTDLGRGAQTQLYKNIFEQSHKAFFFDPRMEPVKRIVKGSEDVREKDEKIIREIVPTAKMMITQGDDSGFGKRSDYDATPYQNNDGWNSLLNAMSQEYDGCNLIGEYPLGQILIDEFQGDKSHSVQEQRATVTEIIEKYKSEENEYKKYKLKKTLIETIKNGRWNEGIFSPETLFIDAMKSSSSVPAVAESIMRTIGGTEEDIARNQTLKGAAQDFDMANAGFPIKENKGKYYGNIKPTHNYNGTDLELEDALTSRFEMLIYFNERKRLKMLQTPFTNELVETFLKTTRENYQALLLFLKFQAKPITTYKTGNTNNITIELMKSFFDNPDNGYTKPEPSLQMAGREINLLYHDDDISLFECMHKEAKSFYAQYALEDNVDQKKPFLKTKDKQEERIFIGNDNKKYTNFLKGGAKLGDIAGMDQYANYFRPRVKNTKKNQEDKALQGKIGKPNLPFSNEFGDDEEAYYKAYLTHLLMHDMKTIKNSGFAKDDTYDRKEIPSNEESIIQRFLNTIESSVNQSNRKSIVKQTMVYEYKDAGGEWIPTTGNFNCLSYGQQGPSVMQLEFQWRKLLLSITKNLGIVTEAKPTAAFIKKNSDRDPSSRVKGKQAMQRGEKLDNVLEDQQNKWFEEMAKLEKNELIKYNSDKKATKKEKKEEEKYNLYLKYRDVFDLYLSLDQLGEDIKEEETEKDNENSQMIKEIDEILVQMRVYIAEKNIEEPRADDMKGITNEEKIQEYEEYFEDRRVEILNKFGDENRRKWDEHLKVLRLNAFSARSTSDDLFKTTRNLIQKNLKKNIKIIDCWKLLSMPLLTKFYSDSGQIQFIKGISCLFRKDRNGKIYKYWIITFDITCGLIALKEGNVMLETGKRIFTGSSGPIDLETRKQAEAIIKNKIQEINSSGLTTEQKDNKINALRFLYNICPEVLKSDTEINENFFVDSDDQLDSMLANSFNLKKINEINKKIFKQKNWKKAEQYEIFYECCREVKLNTLLDESIAIISDDKKQVDNFSLQIQELTQLVNQLKRLHFEKMNKKGILEFERAKWNQLYKTAEEADDEVLLHEYGIKIDGVNTIIKANEKDLKVIRKTITNWETVIKDKISLSSRTNDITKLIFSLKDFLNSIGKNKFIFDNRSGNLPSEGILNDIRPKGMMGEHPVTKDEEPDVYWLFHESNKQWDRRTTYLHKDREKKRKDKRDDLEKMHEPTEEELIISEYVGHDPGLGRKLDTRASIYKNVKGWMENNELSVITDIEKQYLPQKRGKKGGITKATETKAINNKIIKTIVILEMMGKIKEEPQANPLGETKYYVDTTDITPEEFEQIRKALEISGENNNEGFEKEFFEFWVLKGDKKDKDETELLDHFKERARYIQKYYRKAYIDNDTMSSENRPIRQIRQDEYEKSIQTHIPEEENPYRKIVKFSVEQTFEDTPSIFRKKMNELVKIWGENANAFDIEVIMKKEQLDKKTPKGSPVGSNASSPSKQNFSPRTPFTKKPPLTGNKKKTLVYSPESSPGSSPGKSSSSEQLSRDVTEFKRKRNASMTNFFNANNPNSPQAKREREEMTEDELKERINQIKKRKTIPEDPLNKDEKLANNKIEALKKALEKKRKDRGVTVSKEKGPKKKKKKGGNKTHKIYRKKGRKSQNKRKKPKKGSKKRRKKPHRNTRKTALKIEN